MSNVLTAKDFTTDQEVRWCPGCGDYAILKALRATLADIASQPHEVVFISGIGCAARFPYYINSYGFHTIHGRAPAIATGVKLANPSLDVWVVGGDGDLLAIGSNHLVHTLRRDIDMNILLINNAIYGLTKGQFSPASPIGTLSPTSPDGSQDEPVNAALLALGCGARFVARSADTMLAHLSETLKRAHNRKGAALVEIFQNCLIYNDGVWDGLANKSTRHDKSIILEHEKPLIFGEARDKGLLFHQPAGTFEIISGARDEVMQRATVFDETNFSQAVSLARMDRVDMPVALGVLYCPLQAIDELDSQKLQRIINGNDCWQVTDTGSDGGNTVTNN